MNAYKLDILCTKINQSNDKVAQILIALTINP